MGLGGMHQQVLMELVDDMTKPLCIVFETSWQSGKGKNIIPIFKKGRKKDLGTIEWSVLP